MKTTFLTRAQYNALVAHEPRFMRDTYANLNRAWSFHGVRVSGPRTAIQSLERLSAAADAAAERDWRRACAADRWDGQT